MADVKNLYTRKLIMTFKTILGRNVSLTVDNPIDDIEESEIIKAMNTIVGADVFRPYGSELQECVSAKVVVTEQDKFDLQA